MTDDFDDELPPRKVHGAGGTKGGIGEFFFGVGLVILGGYLVMQRVTVHSGYWSWFGGSTFGVTLLPLLFGIGLLFFNGKSMLGWLLAGGGLLVIFAGVLLNLNISFTPTSLFTTLLMFGCMAAGLGLIARSVREH
jgi:hypothetical protein